MTGRDLADVLPTTLSLYRGSASSRNAAKRALAPRRSPMTATGGPAGNSGSALLRVRWLRLAAAVDAAPIPAGLLAAGGLGTLGGVLGRLSEPCCLAAAAAAKAARPRLLGEGGVAGRSASAAAPIEFRPSGARSGSSAVAVTRR